jgi:hypothetical protein
MERFGCHAFFNYQFHLEGIPKDASVTILGMEHLIDDWNSAEYTIGGKRNVLGSDQTVLLHNNVNKASEQESKSKYLSVE